MVVTRYVIELRPEVEVGMRSGMLGYWVIFAGVVLQIFGWLWDLVDDLSGEEALGGLLTPERLIFLGFVLIVLGLVLGFRLGPRRRR
jgi:uncharacterized membrane protein